MSTLLDSVQFAVGGIWGRRWTASQAHYYQAFHPFNSIRTTLCCWGAFQLSSRGHWI
ncbi:hypothetical protein BCR35DRAFT_309235, partial [Leucosporidium creatinivorum]